ncbi:MAG: hypothetical protein HC809_09375 [Gammaproteobacteria bacterium]|nr:hypothetical protein [Gammaproteobacteria bacterium]
MNRYTDFRPFDVMCTHSILTYAPIAGRQALVANWRVLLRPGGRVITVSRLISSHLRRSLPQMHGRRSSAIW